MSATGTWNAHIISLMGKNPVQFDIVEDTGILTGTATAEGETVPLVKGSADGDDLYWEISITKPFRMDFIVRVHVEDDTWEGTAKARGLPVARVIGERATGS